MTGEPLHLFPHLLDRLQSISDGLTLVSQQNTLISPAALKNKLRANSNFLLILIPKFILDTY